MSPVVILCGGEGSRLRERFPNLPKALVPVAGRPFLEHQLRWLMAAGARQVHLAAGYRSEALLEWRRNYRAPHHRALTLTISVEPRPLDTAGAIRYAADALQAQAIIVVNGDTIVPELDFQTLEKVGAEFSSVWKPWKLRFPTAENKVEPHFQPLETPGAVMAVAPVADTGRFGAVELTRERKVRSFAEKRISAGAGWANAGIYRLDMALVRAWPSDCVLSMERVVLPALAKAGLLTAVRVGPPLLDIGTPQGLEETEQFLAGKSFMDKPFPPRKREGKPGPKAWNFG